MLLMSQIKEIKMISNSNDKVEGEKLLQEQALILLIKMIRNKKDFHQEINRRQLKTMVYSWEEVLLL